MSERFEATEDGGLLDALIKHLDGWSRSRIKQRLRDGRVVVQGVRVSQFDHPLRVGDRVEVLARAERPPDDDPGLEILYAENDLVAIHKPAGLLSVALDEGNAPSALSLLREQLSPRGRRIDLWPVHRIDRDTSGVLLFALTQEARWATTGAWDKAEKTYLAVVEGVPEPDEGTVDRPLRMDSKGFRALVGWHSDAKPARTHYETRRVGRENTLLEVRIETGRQHQIRAHLAWLGHPIVGDARYGTKGRRMGLHALRLVLPSPGGGDPITIEAPPDGDLLRLLR